MEPFIVSARKYRPQTFEDVVGQSSITQTLENAIASNHLAQALLFTGPRGVGKTTCARILAKKINHASGEFAADEDFAFNIFELDAASNNGVEHIRSIVDQVRIPPQVGAFKIYIIDEVHMLSNAAFNAFLKTLEEPPAHAIFILATTEKHKIIPTILSRCQIFDFKRITIPAMRDHLKRIADIEGITADEEALHIIAQKADGALRDSLSIFDRVISFSGKNLTLQAVTENLNVLDRDTYFKITDLILDHNIPQLLVDYDLIMSKGFDGQHFISGLASHFRDLMVCIDERTIALLEVGDVNKVKYKEQSKRTDFNFLRSALEKANDTDFNYRNSRNQRLLVELCLMQLASINADGEKKNDLNFILPATYFINHIVKPTSLRFADTGVHDLISSGNDNKIASEIIDAAPIPNSVALEITNATIQNAENRIENTRENSTESSSETKADDQQEDLSSSNNYEEPVLIEIPTVNEDVPEIDSITEMAFDFALDFDGIENINSTPLDSQPEVIIEQAIKIDNLSTSTPPEKSFVKELIKDDKNLSSETPRKQENATHINKLDERSVDINIAVDPTVDIIAQRRNALLAKKNDSKVSKYSLQAIDTRNAINQQSKPVEHHADSLPTEPFTLEQLLEKWNDFTSYLENKGQLILASILRIDEPKLEGEIIKLQFPNQSIKEDLEASQGLLLDHLKRELQNYNITIDITVDRALEKKYAFTDEEKFQKLVDKNPAMALLKTTFSLDF